MGAVAIFSALSFAQTDVTNKVLNPDAEKGMLGWDVTFVDGGQIWNKQTKGEEKAPGYYGFDNWAFENWRNAAAPLTNSSIYQVIKNLPNGTYVFGAYAMATNDSWEPSIEIIEGVSMFANENSVPVATHRVEGMDTEWAHSIKFNVATTVTDGTLKIGMQNENTNANFIAMDNVTLYYFEDMDHAAALEEMAKIDIAATVKKVTPYLEASKMNADTLALLQTAIDAAAEVTAETAAQIDANLYWGKRQAKKSIADYNSLAEAIAVAKEVAAMEWSEFVADDLDALNAMIEEVEAAYEAGNAFRAEIEAMKANLAEAVSIVELDGIYTLLEVYTERVDSIGDLEGDEIGEYTGEMVERAEELLDEVNFELSLTGEVSATEIKTNCNTLFAKIQNIIDNPINYYEFPILLHGSDKVLPGQSGAGAGKSPWPVLEGAYDYNMPAGEDLNGVAHNGYNNLIEYKSPLFRFREPLTSVRFYIRAVGDPGEVDKNGNPHICISGFAMYDENGDIINLTTENVTSNATEREGQGIPGMLDYNPNTFFHSLWKTGTPEPHYIEVTLPEGQYSAFSFKMISYQNTRSRVFPKEMEITYVSPKAAELQQALLAVRKLNPVFGTAPGFFNFDPTYYNAILEEADVVANKKGALDSEIQVSLDKVNSILAKFEEGVTLPEPGKKYRIISGEPRFFTNQNIMKTLTLHTDTIYGNWLWWETAHPDSARQEFILEPCETETDRLYYTFKHAETGLYLSELFDSVGTLIPNRFVFTEQPDSFYIQSLGYGQFGIFASDANSRKQLNMEFHNNGVWSENVQNYGAIAGVKSYIHTWGSSANQSSAWFFREMVTLPQAVKSISELNFRSDALSIYEGVNNLTITADKECAFTDLVVVDVFGNDVAIEELSVEGKVATLKLSKNVETFSVIFTNDEGVAEITIDGFYKYEGVSAAYTALQDKYNEVSAIAPVVGTAVGQVKDVTEYNTAIENALAFLENGAEDAELEAATAALEAAKAGLEFNLPQEDVEYLMLIGLDAIKTNHLTDMAIFADAAQSAPRWTYVSLTNNDFRWKFVDCGELKNGRKAYYIENVGTGLYTATTAENSAMALVEDTTETRPFDIHFMSNGKVAMGDSYWDNGQQCFHPMNHGSGAAANKGGYMISYHKGDPASVMYIVEADKYINDVLLTLDIEDVEIADKNVSPAVKGTFDLFGRRIEKPATTGIYIVDGKKVVIMK
jgi:hypothetical protein